MVSVTLHAHGDATPQQAWERYADPQRWSQWSPQVQRVESSTPRLTAGMTGTVRAGLLPRPTLGVPFEVLTVDDAARTWTWRVRLGPVRLHLEHGVEAADGGSATWLRLSGPLPVVTAYAPVARFALGRLVASA